MNLRLGQPSNHNSALLLFSFSPSYPILVSALGLLNGVIFCALLRDGKPRADAAVDGGGAGPGELGLQRAVGEAALALLRGAPGDCAAYRGHGHPRMRHCRRRCRYVASYDDEMGMQWELFLVVKLINLLSDGWRHVSEHLPAPAAAHCGATLMRCDHQPQHSARCSYSG